MSATLQSNNEVITNISQLHSRRFRMFVRASVLLLLVSGLHTKSMGQGTITFQFEGVPPRSNIGVQEYSENGMWFRPIGGPGPGKGFARMGSDSSLVWPDWPYNGTAFISVGFGDTLMFSFTDNRLFDLVSVDMSEWSKIYQIPWTVHFVGFRADGSVVSTDIRTDGVIDGTGPRNDFETFRFGEEWTQLTHVEIPTAGWALDNLVVSVPEPATGALAALALVFLSYRRIKRTS